jgi:hypothetical protein
LLGCLTVFTRKSYPEEKEEEEEEEEAIGAGKGRGGTKERVSQQSGTVTALARLHTVDGCHGN